MSKPFFPDKVAFFTAITYGEEKPLQEVTESLSLILGKPVFTSVKYDFSSFTDYYEKEMGSSLKKQIFFFEKLKSPDFLVELKWACYELEKKTSKGDGKRRVNIDPGYLALSKLVLATFKDFSHRIYIGKSVFAEVTLIFKNKKFVPLPWTYPDYSQEKIVNFLIEVRNWYKETLRSSHC